MLILASNSPRRRELLSLISKDFVIKSAKVDETLPEGISPAEAVLYLSAVKAEPFRKKTDTVIGADTVVAVDHEILGKPESPEHAKSMLTKLSGRIHNVYTGVTVIDKCEKMSFFCETKVKFYDLTEKEIEDYIATGEPLDKAGSYGIQGLGSLFVESIEGDYFNVVGLPVSRLNRILQNKTVIG